MKMQEKLQIIYSRYKKKQIKEKIIFSETTTLGIRHQRMERTILERELSKIMTKYGEITVKKSKLDEMYRDYPEYDSVVKAC